MSHRTVRFAVSALMASPLAQGLFHRAIGESGAFFPSRPRGLPRSPGREREGGHRSSRPPSGPTTIAALRAKPAEEMLKTRAEARLSVLAERRRLRPAGGLAAIFAEGKQARVPLLAGWNADESRAGVVLGKEKPTAESFTARPATLRRARRRGVGGLCRRHRRRGARIGGVAGGDLFIGYGTWKWIEVHGQTGASPVYRYSFDRKIPMAPATR